jgi:glutamate-5-semialdehyde dehydrogenase
MQQTIISELKKVKAISASLALLSEADRNQVLLALADKLRHSGSAILRENAKDLALMSPENPMRDRLLLTPERINAIASEIEAVVLLTSPLGQRHAHSVRPNGLKIEKQIVPLGVIAVIYESRPNVTIDVFSLCFKTGNAVVLKGGKEAQHTNSLLVQLIHEVLTAHSIDTDIVYLLPVNKDATHAVLHATGLVDVCIPRGSQSLINYVREHAKIPVIETGAGIVHTYFDADADFSKGRDIIHNAKTRRVSVCNALDCLIMHKSRLDVLFDLVVPLLAHNVELFADADSYARLQAHYPANLLHAAREEDFGREFLSHKLAIKTVASVKEAVHHIQKYSSAHSEAIISEDPKAIDYFLTRVDAAAVYVNASTAFTDGAQFGLGTEIGISTQKLHARGPMGLEALTSYKWLIHGNGQVRP